MQDLKTILPPQAPVMASAIGSAWPADLEAIRAASPNPDDSTVCAWYVHAPYAHPAWHSYVILAIHLRPIPGRPGPKINLQGATHEVVVMALQPDQPMRLDQPARMLTPANFIGQFIEPDDESAVKRIRQCVQDVVDGKLNPDTDYTQWWIRRFSASNINGNPAEAGQTVITVGDAAIVIPPVQAPND